MNDEQCPGRRRQRPEAIDHLGFQVVEPFGVRGAGHALVELQADVYVRNVVLGQQRRQLQVHLGPGGERRLEVGIAALAQRRHCALEELEVEADADLLDLSALFLAEELAGAADLEVLRREREPGPEVFERLNRLEALTCVLGERCRRWRDQVRPGAVVRTTDATAKLVQLREAKAVGAVDQDRVRSRYVDAGLDNRGAYEQLETPVIEVEHELLEVTLAHLAVADADRRLGHQAAQALREDLDVLDGVVHEIDLPAAADLAQAGLAHEAVAPLRDESLDGDPLCGRRRHQREVSKAAERHVERTGYRGRGQRQRVDIGAQLLEPLLVPDAEAVFLVHHDEAEVVEGDVALQQAMRPDHDVNTA